MATVTYVGHGDLVPRRGAGHPLEHLGWAGVRVKAAARLSPIGCTSEKRSPALAVTPALAGSPACAAPSAVTWLGLVGIGSGLGLVRPDANPNPYSGPDPNPNPTPNSVVTSSCAASPSALVIQHSARHC
eukprot:scaffold117046_cov57-Phaeocystis_antarctica.AAC.1